MTSPDLLVDLANIVAHSTAPAMVAECLEALDRALPGVHTLWLTDLQQTVLTPLGHAGDSRAVKVDDSWPGRCFASQASLHAKPSQSLYVPVSARGERVGVLEHRRDVIGLGHGDGSPTRLDLGELQGVHYVVASMLALALSSRSVGTDEYERSRRTRPLTLAAELQWSLLHARSYRDDQVSVGGTLEPAYAVAGDAFDWARDGQDLFVNVLDGAGEGVPAALTTALALTALRNARATGLDLTDQAALADQALYSHHGGKAYVSALLLQIDLTHGALSVIDAGSPLLLRVRGSDIERIALDPQLPLGMFDESIYVRQHLQLQPRDRLVIVSDGIHSSGKAAGGTFGDHDLDQAIAACRLLPAPELTRHVLRALHDTLPESAGGRIDDDAVIVCIDWPGPAQEIALRRTR